MRTTTKKHPPGLRLRWRKDRLQRHDHPGDESHTLRDANGTRFAMVQRLRVGGWFWVAGWEAREHGVPHMNTCGTPTDTAAQAKAEAMAYVKAALAAKERSP